MEESDIGELHAVLRAAAMLFSPEAGTPVDDVEDFAAARRELERAWHVVISALAGSREASEVVCTTASVPELLRRIRHVDQRVARADTRRREEALSAVRDALSGFRQVRTVEQLVELAPRFICGIGFDRAIVSSIQDATVVNEALYIQGDTEWAAEILAVGKENPQYLGPALRETEVVRRRSGLLVTNVQSDRKVNRPIADASRSRSYVAAPIMQNTDVIGLLHGDRYFHTGDVDEFDRDLLSLFGEGLSAALERTMLLDRIEAIRTQVNRIADGGPPTVASARTGQSATSVGSPNWTIPRPVDSVPFSVDEIVPLLTRRELEVLRLMAAGHSNARIATRLVLADTTVKSHVKHILRKLRATNRAEAVSRWLMAESGHCCHGVHSPGGTAAG